MIESPAKSAAVGRRRPRLGITIGDPAGIGPEVSLKALSSGDINSDCIPILIGDAQYLHHWAKVFGLPQISITIDRNSAIPDSLDEPAIYDLQNLSGFRTLDEMGVDSGEAGRAAGSYIEAGVRLCMSGEIDALTTAPISKKALSLAGYSFPGHTEMLAHLSGSEDFAMAFISPLLRVALLTTHVALGDVPALVEQSGLERLIRLVDRELKSYGLAQPRIALAALNPHGGEGGLFGIEERREMIPAIESCRLQDGIDVSGPHSGDTVFVRASRGEFDIVISCYHDQGLIPIKCFSFGEAVNVTLGLRFIRTSVDHGTAFDIAGRGVAEQGSMIAAINLAINLFQQRAAAQARLLDA